MTIKGYASTDIPLHMHERTLLTHCRSKNRWSMVFSLAIATVLRTGLVIISYGCKVPAGIFVPSMAVGASFGRMVGIMVQALHESFPQSAFFASCDPDVPCITPGTYAFLGAGAALSGIMHLTISVTVIMFELTGALTYILPTMVSLHSKWDCFIFNHTDCSCKDRGRRHQSRWGPIRQRRYRRSNDLVQRIPIPRQQRRSRLQRTCIPRNDRRPALGASIGFPRTGSRTSPNRQQIPRLPRRGGPHFQNPSWIYRPNRTPIRHRPRPQPGHHRAKRPVCIHQRCGRRSRCAQGIRLA